MSNSYVVRCPMCGHETPRPARRDFLICTCGLRLACGRAPDDRRHRAGTVFALLALVAMVGAAVDLLRHFW
jgi:hypothetical protein